MKKRIKKQVNKNLKMILIIGVVVVIAMGLLLMLISGNDQDRDQVPIDPTAEQQEEKKEKKERHVAEIGDHPGVSDVALAMYNARVDDIKDTAQVAQLLEATDMREELGGYLVTLKTKDGEDTLIIAFENKLTEGDELKFNESATWYAEQLLALIEEADVIKWTYTIEGKKDKVVKRLTREESDELLGTETAGYSKSPEMVQTLLNNQKGIV